MKYDVIIVGGGTAGCACAYTAANLGLKTLVIEKSSCLGGTMTSALVTPAMKSNTNSKLNSDFYEFLMNELKQIGGQVTYLDGNIGWFNPELLKITLDKILLSSGVDIIFDTEVSDVIRNKDKVLGITLNTRINPCNETIYSDKINNDHKILLEYIETEYLVDGTGDAKIFEKINHEFLNNFENISDNKYQPANLRFIMSGVNVKTFSEWILKIDNNRDVTTAYSIDAQIHLSTAYTGDSGAQWALAPIFSEGMAENLITAEDCNYFQLFTIPGMPDSVAFNCPRISGEVDNNNKIQVSKALIKGRESIIRLSNFLKSKFIGFENAYISSIANTLGIRVSNRIKGKYIYTIDDLTSGKTFDNPVLISKYPVDVHSTKDGESILERQEKEYMLPVESLISEKYDNLFAIGRCISADFMAQAALRIIPSCFAMGEGLAKYIYNKKRASL